MLFYLFMDVKFAILLRPFYLVEGVFLVVYHHFFPFLPDQCNIFG